MKFDDFFKTIRDSDVADWVEVESPVMAASEDGERHSTLIVNVNNISISVALGLPAMSSFNEEWATGFPDKHAKAYYADFLYCGAPVYRSMYVAVDGHRAYLPLPRAGTLEVSEAAYDVWRVINRSAGDYDDYFNRAGLKTVPTAWPR